MERYLEKVSIWCMAALVILSLQGCFPERQEASFKVVFSQCTGGDAWRQEMETAMWREKEFHPSIELEIVDAKANTEKQIKDIDSLIQAGIDLLIVSPNEAEPITPVVEKAFSAEIPVIILDRKTDSRLYSAYIGADNFEIGKTAGNYIQNIRSKYERTRIVEIWGSEGSSPAQERHSGFVEAIRDDESLKLVGEVTTNWEADGVEKEFGEVLDEGLEFDVLFVHNDRMALKAFQMLREREREDEVDIIGVDGLSGPRGGMQQVADGILKATLLYPHGGEEAIRMAEDILRKKGYAKDNFLQSTIIDKNNVRILKMQSEKLASQQEQITRQQKRINDQAEIYRDQTTALYVLVFSLISALILGAVVYYSLMAKQEANLVLEGKNQEILAQQEQIVEMAQKAEEATQAKLKFFTNISHEFRTPLTLILGPVEEILSDDLVHSSHIKKQLLLMRKNAIRLLRLVNQLMDFRKIENNKMRLRVSRHDVKIFLSDIFEAYEASARRRNINYNFKYDFKDTWLWFDAQMLDKVLFNLLSNAFKFTKDGGGVWMKVTDENSSVLLEVGDNGRGMSPEHVVHAFDRFYQGESYKTRGTGLGLSLSQELIQLHHGEIWVESEKGVGTRFFVRLRKGNEHFSQESLSLTAQGFDLTETTLLYVDEEGQRDDSSQEESGEGKHDLSILLIEDHIELRNFIKSSLSREYEIMVAGDAESAFEIAKERIPDLIICDVMLPGQDGRSLTKAVKQEIKTSHIPIILLTAQASMNQKIKGIQSGADLYLTKPFSIEVLLEHIKNLIKNREVLRESFIEAESIFSLPSEKDQLQLNPLDKKFVKSFKEMVALNIKNSSFGVMDLCEELGLSRVQLYRKVKALLGYTVSEYIKELRLEISKQLLLKNELTIAQVAYDVGFTTPAYFSTAFKTRYNLSPSEYKNSKPLKKDDTDLKNHDTYLK